MRLVAAAVALLLLSASSLSAQEKILIEDIVVEHPAGIPDRIITSETRLTEGSSYTKEEIRQAIYRVRRLAFVTGAMFRLEPGATPGGQRLVIVVAPTKRFNMSLDLMYRREEEFHFGFIAPNAGYRVFFGNSSFDATIGIASVTQGGGDFSNFIMRYSGYDLFGTRASVELSVTRTLESRDLTSAIAPGLRVVVPINRLQSIVGTYNRIEEERTINFGITRVPGIVTFERAVAELLWSRDTTDDPHFALTGSALTAGPRLILVDTLNPIFIRNPERIEYRSGSDNQYGAAFAANRFFQMSEKSAIVATVTGSGAQERRVAGDVETRSDRFESEGSVVAALNVGPFFKASEYLGYPGRHRFQAGVAARYFSSQSDLFTSSDTLYGATAAYIYRHPRMFFRFTANYYAR